MRPQAIRKSVGAARRSRRTSTPRADVADMVVALDRLQAMRADGRERQPRGRLVRRRPARRPLPHPPRRRGGRQGARRRASWSVNGVEPRRRASRQPRRRGPAGLRRHARRLRRGAGDPGAEGARAARDLLSVHPDGRAGGQRRCRTRTRDNAARDRPAGLPLARAHHLLAGGGLRRQRRQDRCGGRAGRGASSARRSPPTSTSPARASPGPAPRATGACGG